jgi:DNA-binding transcriptional MerR regulator
MSQNNIGQQLDLFGNFFSPIEEKKEAIVVETTEPEKNDFVFLDDKIGVKIKLKSSEPKADKTILKSKPTVELTAEKNVTNTSKTKSKRGRKSFKDIDAEVDLIDIPDDETLNKKLYYPIREVAAFFKCNTSLIRAWEVEFDILQPRKNRKGDRLFRVEDIKNLQVIYYLLRNKKLSVEGAKVYLKNNKKKADTQQQLTHTLNKFKGFLLELKATLALS